MNQKKRDSDKSGHTVKTRSGARGCAGGGTACLAWVDKSASDWNNIYKPSMKNQLFDLHQSALKFVHRLDFARRLSILEHLDPMRFLVALNISLNLQNSLWLLMRVAHQVNVVQLDFGSLILIVLFVLIPPRVLPCMFVKH